MEICYSSYSIQNVDVCVNMQTGIPTDFYVQLLEQNVMIVSLYSLILSVCRLSILFFF